MIIKDMHKLRLPSGPWIVGCTHLFYEFTLEGKNRVVPCLCFYPAESIGEGQLKKYVSERILPGTSGIITNSYVNAPVSEGKHPLILYNHGYGFFCEANTVQCEELASHGYIVLSVGHQGDGAYELPDGRIMAVDMEMMRGFSAAAAIGMETVLKYSEWLRHCSDTTIDKHCDLFETIIDNHPSMTAKCELWVKDSLMALEMFLKEADQGKGIFHNHLARENIGAFGMSLGGSVSLSLAQVSNLIKASANLDGFYFSSMWYEPVNKPVVLMQNDSEISGHLLTLPYLIQEDNAYLITFKDSVHGNFMDYNEIIAENLIANNMIKGIKVKQALLGEIEPDKMEDILNMLLLDFFDKYLKGKQSRVIDTDVLPSDILLLKK